MGCTMLSTRKVSKLFYLQIDEAHSEFNSFTAIFFADENEGIIALISRPIWLLEDKYPSQIFKVHVMSLRNVEEPSLRMHNV